jgi:hypothetical protein
MNNAVTTRMAMSVSPIVRMRSHDSWCYSGMVIRRFEMPMTIPLMGTSTLRMTRCQRPIT